MGNHQNRIWRPNLFVGFAQKLVKRPKIFWPLMVGLIFLMLFGFSQILKQPKWCSETEYYLVATETIPAGQKIVGRVELKERPVAFQSASAIRQLEAITGKVARVTILEGEVVMSERLLDSFLKNVKTLAIPVRQNQRPNLVAGDQVDLYSTISLTGDNSEEFASTLIAKDSLVHSVDEQKVSVIIDETELEAVVSALASAEITLVLTS